MSVENKPEKDRDFVDKIDAMIMATPKDWEIWVNHLTADDRSNILTAATTAPEDRWDHAHELYKKASTKRDKEKKVKITAEALFWFMPDIVLQKAINAMGHEGRIDRLKPQ